ncbi:MAG: ZIP family metal transporter [Candidatus Nanohaloarchaeota archaeon QJJ-5]|nr:ZIP family metal transporter [Candidatus Nanohaloarchaeota archaeon QJJ-5]
MVDAGSLILVFIAGLITALATGLGAIPFFFVDTVDDRWEVLLWGLASGIMVAASLFGLLEEAVAAGAYTLTGAGILTGVILVMLSERFLDQYDVDPRDFAQADMDKLVLILGILTIHSFPEGIAVGVSFAELNVSGYSMLGFTVPLLAIMMTIAISIHNIPEGLAISIPLRSMGVGKRGMVWWSVFSSLPQPIGAVIAFAFVKLAQQFLPFGFGFAAGAMIFLVLSEFIPEALEHGDHLDGGGRKELIAGIVIGVTLMLPFLFLDMA